MSSVGDSDSSRLPSAAEAEVGLFLADGGGRGHESASSEIAVGVIRLQGWQVQPILPRPPGFPGQDGYLVKVNYDLLLEPEVPAPSWFEVAFALGQPTEGPVAAVLDAVPRTVLEREPASSYVVSEYLNLVPISGGGSNRITLPAALPAIDVFGIGGSEIRWRHSARGANGVRVGSYSCWMVIVVTEGCTELPVDVSARFDLTPDEALGYQPANRGSSFRLPLAQPLFGSLLPAPAGTPRPDAVATVPRVFVSYAHDDEFHTEAVRAFSEFLASGCGLDVHMDRWDLDLRRDWYLWAIGQIKQADFVLVIASPMCRLVGDGEMPDQKHRGMQSELSVLREFLHSDRAEWRAKLLPVILPGRSAMEIPVFLQPQTADHYYVSDLTAAGAEDLLRAITGQPPYVRPPLHTRVVDFPTEGGGTSAAGT